MLFFNLVGPILLLSVEKCTERSIVYGLIVGINMQSINPLFKALANGIDYIWLESKLIHHIWKVNKRNKRDTEIRYFVMKIS